MKGHIIILSGPSGVGKDTVLQHWMRINPRVQQVISYTTRKPRVNEIDGKDYHFVDQATFEKMIEQNLFLEHKIVFGNGYATPNQSVQEIIQKNEIAILKIDTQGAIEIMKKRPDIISIFLLPKSLDQLESQLRSRGTESDQEITKRLNAAQQEIQASELYHHQIINDDPDFAAQKIEAIIAQLDSDE